MGFGEVEGLRRRLHPRRWQSGLDSPRLQRLMRIAVLLLSVFLLGLFLYAAARRMHYPFEVEWIESGILVSVLRIAHGQGLYVAPTLNFVPYLYAPLYLYLAAGLTRIVGVAHHGYAAMRLLSTLSTLGSCVAVYALVMSGTRRRIAGVAAAGMFVGCYSVLGGFYDIGRVDSLFVFLLLLALLAQRRGHPVMAALLWVLTCQTKQTVLPLAVFILCAEWQRPRRAFAAVATFVVAAGASILLLNYATSGWYDFYLFDLVQGLPVVARQAALYLPVMVLEPMAIAWATIAAALLLPRVETNEMHDEMQGRALRWLSKETMFYLFVSVALYGGTWFVEAHRGASANAMMPVYAWTAVLFGAALGRLLERAETDTMPRLALVTLTAAALQLLALVYNPGRYVPPASATTENEEFIAQLRSIPGDVYVLNHSYDEILAGKQPHAEGEALGAVLDAKVGQTSANLLLQLNQAVQSRQFTAVVIDDPRPTSAGDRFQAAYPLAESTGLSNLRYLTSQPQWFLLPCNAPPQLAQGLLRPDSVVAAQGCAK